MGGGNAPSAGGGTPYGGGAQGPGGPYGTPDQPFSIQLVVEGANDIADNAHAQYKPGSKVKVSIIARDARGNVVSGCEPVFELAENSDADGVPHGALAGNEVTFLHDGKFSIFAHCKDNPNITTRGEHNNYNFETSSGQFAHCTNTPDCNACVDKCDINALEDKARKANGDAPKHAGTNPATILLVVGLGALAAYLLYIDLGGGNYCFDITSSNNGACPPNHYCFGSQGDCETNLAQTQAICQCHVAQCTVDFTGCSASAREGSHDIHDVNSLVASGFANQRRTERPTPLTSSQPGVPHTSTRAIVVGAALGAAAVATTGYVLWREMHSKPGRVEIVPWVSPSGGGVTAMGRF